MVPYTLEIQIYIEKRTFEIDRNNKCTMYFFQKKILISLF